MFRSDENETMKADQERIRTLLTDTVTLLCRNGLHYIKELKVEGLIGITLDGGEVFIVHINEKIVEDDVKFTRIEDSPSQCLQNFSTNQSAERKINDSNSETVPLSIHSLQKKKRKYSSSSSAVLSKMRQSNESSFEGTALQTVETIQNSSEEETNDRLVHVKEENRGGIECCKNDSIGEIVLLDDNLAQEVNCKSKVQQETKNAMNQMISKRSSSLDQPTSLKDSEDSNKISSAPIVGSMLKTSRQRKTGRMFSGFGGQETEFQGHSSNVPHQIDTDQGHQPVQLDVDGATFLNYSIDDEVFNIQMFLYHPLSFCFFFLSCICVKFRLVYFKNQS